MVMIRIKQCILLPTIHLPSQLNTFDFIISDLKLGLVFLEAFNQGACQMGYAYTVDKSVGAHTG